MELDKLNKWLQKIKGRDPELYQRITERLAQQPEIDEAVAFESTTGASPPRPQRTLETIVMESGRPAIPIKADRPSYADAFIDDASKHVIDELKRAEPLINPLIPLIGRIDVSNYPISGVSYVGTGWQIEPNVIVTNRHVAQLIAKHDGRKFVFIRGAFGNPLEVSVDYKHELQTTTQDSVTIEEVIWIEENTSKADIAFLKIADRSDGNHQNKIELADVDASPGDPVAVIGYPARGQRDAIPNQQLMDQIYRGVYDIKRIAPGMMDDNSQGWATHDCTTLGGKSGSPVVDLKTGKAVALHFAGLYMIENYAVPASIVRSYLRYRPWQGGSTNIETGSPDNASQLTSNNQTPSTSASLTIPVTIRVDIGHGVEQQLSLTADQTGNDFVTNEIELAAKEYARQKSDHGIISIRSGYLVKSGSISDEPCINVWVDPLRLDEAREYISSTHFSGFPVVIESAPVVEQAAPFADGDIVAESAVQSVSYNDEDRADEKFSFEEIDQQMSVTCHVGPERGWEILSEFLAAADKELICSIYQFHADHIAKVISSELDDDISVKLVMDNKTRDPKSDVIKQGDFDRSDTFADWKEKHDDRFQTIFVPVRSNGLVAYSYHIKVTVRDQKAFWLSSGNWKNSSQPIIAEHERNDLKVLGRSGNREWHVVVENKELANRFRNHIIADFEQSKKLGGRPEASFEQEIYVDIPESEFTAEAAELEAAPQKILEPLQLERKVKVKPLMTPDQKGSIYSEAVLGLIESAKDQLLFQIPYISMNKADAGFLKELVDALVKQFKEVDDFRLILRRGGDLHFNLTELKKRGLDIRPSVTRAMPHTHTKGMIVDSQRVLIGSHNWSRSGVTLNRDASLIFDDVEIANYYREAFEIDWLRATKITVSTNRHAEAAVLATTATPLYGYRRVPLTDYFEG